MRTMQIVVVGAMALLALVGAVLVARGGEWSLVALPACVCAIGLAGLSAGGSVQARRVSALPVLLVGVLAVVLGVVAVVTSTAPVNIIVALAVLGTVFAVVGALLQVRRTAAAPH